MRYTSILRVLLAIVIISSISLDAQTSQPVASLKDANGNSLKRAKTGHLTNYDESKVGTYILPSLLTLTNGQSVTDAATWLNVRRPEILKLYKDNIYGYIPTSAPSVRYEISEPETGLLNNTAIRKILTVHFGPDTSTTVAHVVIYLPASAKGPVPLLVHMTFAGAYPTKPNSVEPDLPHKSPFSELGPIDEIIARGYGYAVIHYTEIEPDMAWSKQGRPVGVRSLALAQGQAEPGKQDWGSISAWAWGVSKMIDYFVADPSIDSKKIGLIGHSRLGKTVIWTGAQDTRLAIVFSSCAGELGTSLARRDYGETVDDMAENFPHQFCGSIQKFRGKWNSMPVDTHMIIALNAPHPVFITGGTKDLWADPKGEFLAEVEAGSVYRLLGKKDLGETEGPALDKPLTSGDLGFHFHTGGHAILPADWAAFLSFADKYLK